MSLWYIGAILSVLGSVASNLGVNMQKYSFLLNDKKSKADQKNYHKDPKYLAGLVLVILGSLGDFAALGLAAQSIVAPIGSVTLVANIFFAHYWLKEKLGRMDLLGTGLIILGSTLAVSFGDHTEKKYTLDQLKHYYGQGGFLAYAVIIIITSIILYLAIRKMQPIKIQLEDTTKRYAAALKSNDIRTAAIEDELLAELEPKYKPFEKIHPFCYCALSGILGAQSILFGKMVAELIGTTIRGEEQFSSPLTYMFMIGMFFSIFTQLHFLALGLRFFHALYVVPVFQCFFITISTLGGAAYFQEFAHFTAVQAALFPIGIILTLTGVYVLSNRKMNKKRDRDQLTTGLAVLSEEAEEIDIELEEEIELEIKQDFALRLHEEQNKIIRQSMDKQRKSIEMNNNSRKNTKNENKKNRNKNNRKTTVNNNEVEGEEEETGDEDVFGPPQPFAVTATDNSNNHKTPKKTGRKPTSTPQSNQSKPSPRNSNTGTNINNNRNSVQIVDDSQLQINNNQPTPFDEEYDYSNNNNNNNSNTNNTVFTALSPTRNHLRRSSAPTPSTITNPSAMLSRPGSFSKVLPISSTLPPIYPQSNFARRLAAKSKVLDKRRLKLAKSRSVDSSPVFKPQSNNNQVSTNSNNNSISVNINDPNPPSIEPAASPVGILSNISNTVYRGKLAYFGAI